MPLGSTPAPSHLQSKNSPLRCSCVQVAPKLPARSCTWPCGGRTAPCQPHQACTTPRHSPFALAQVFLFSHEFLQGERLRLQVEQLGGLEVGTCAARASRARVGSAAGAPHCASAAACEAPCRS
eukprot:366496-Chlamydomonas_euryale.AAC.11